MYDYLALEKFCETDKQRKAIEALSKTTSQARAATELGVGLRNLTKMLKIIKANAASKAVGPDRDVDHETLEGWDAKRISTAYDREGEIALQWVIQEPEKRSIQARVASMLEGMKDDLGGLKQPVAAPARINADYMAMYIIGDHHFGMLADGETKLDDANWDIKIASEVLLSSADKLAHRVGDAEVGLLLNVGDFFHADSSKNETSQGTRVDVDTRIGKTFLLAGRLFQILIDKMLCTHKQVIVVNVRGNHDTDMAVHVSTLLQLLYAKEPRVEVPLNYSKFMSYQWHNNLFVFHHGDKIKHEQILQTVIKNLDEEWSQSKNRYCHLGHIHHHTAREIGSMHFEHWGSLTATDQWHSDSGYGAERSMSAVVYHKDSGEDSRVKIKVA